MGGSREQDRCGNWDKGVTLHIGRCHTLHVVQHHKDKYPASCLIFVPTSGSRNVCAVSQCSASLSAGFLPSLACVHEKLRKPHILLNSSINTDRCGSRENMSPEVTIRRTEVADSENGEGGTGQMVRQRENAVEIVTGEKMLLS